MKFPQIIVYGLTSKHFECSHAMLKVITANFFGWYCYDPVYFSHKSPSILFFQRMLVRFLQGEIAGWRDKLRLWNVISIGENVPHRQNTMMYPCPSVLYVLSCIIVCALRTIG